MNIIEELIYGLKQLSLLESLAVFFSFSSTVFLIYNHVLVFPFTILGSSLYVWLLYQSGIYAEILISIYFIVTSIIGWYYWSRGVFDLGPPIIERANSTDWKIVIACFLFFYLILHYFLDNYTDSNIVFFDSLTTSLAFVATLLMIRKRIENWVIWIIAVAIIIPICFYKQLYLTSIFYVFTLGLNITGLIKWNSILKAKEVRL